jgi:acyl-coenzyme A thioesterase 13
LVDICSTLTLMIFGKAAGGSGNSSVSQSLSMVYHSPAGLGDKLKIISYTLTIGARAESARTEIWNATHHRLVASGVHIKMSASAPKTKL